MGFLKKGIIKMKKEAVSKGQPLFMPIATQIVSNFFVLYLI
jgi:hypothetical protein